MSVKTVITCFSCARFIDDHLFFERIQVFISSWLVTLTGCAAAPLALNNMLPSSVTYSIAAVSQCTVFIPATGAERLDKSLLGERPV